MEENAPKKASLLWNVVNKVAAIWGMFLGLAKWPAAKLPAIYP